LHQLINQVANHSCRNQLISGLKKGPITMIRAYDMNILIE
jgi:hypothetical protein